MTMVPLDYILGRVHAVEGVLRDHLQSIDHHVDEQALKEQLDDVRLALDAQNIPVEDHEAYMLGFESSLRQMLWVQQLYGG